MNKAKTLIAILGALNLNCSNSLEDKTISLSGVVLDRGYLLEENACKSIFYKNNPAHYGMIKIMDSKNKIYHILVSSDPTYIGDDGKKHIIPQSYRNPEEIRALVRIFLDVGDSLLIKARKFKTVNDKDYYIATEKVLRYISPEKENYVPQIDPDKWV